MTGFVIVPTVTGEEVSKIFDKEWQWTKYEFVEDFFDEHPISWAAACEKIKHVVTESIDKNDISILNNFGFDPRQRISCIPHACFMGYKTICFTFHIDGLVTRHTKHHSPSYITIGFLIHNTKGNTQKHYFFLRSTFIPNSKHWTTDHYLEILQKELSTFANGIPCPDHENPGKFHLLKFVNLGFVADGQELHVPLHHTSIHGYAGAFLVRDNIKQTQTRIGDDHTNCFIPRRILTNTVG